MIPKHLEIAIKHEESLIELREKQIEGYKKRIALMKNKLMSYGKTQTEVPPVACSLKFDEKSYGQAKKKYEKKQKV